jgi:PPIC-type PPIASE domain
MASASSTSSLNLPAVAAHRKSPLPAWLREPLLHFVLLGGVLFAIDHFIFIRNDNPLAIVVSAEVDNEAKKIFRDSRGRDPNADELRALRERWVDNEVLYREGLAMKVDRGDTAIRERVIFKSLSLVEASTKRPPFDEKTLRDWFEANRTKYDEPPRFDFQEAVLAGDTTEPVVRAFAAVLNAGTPGDAKAGLRVFKGRPRENLVQSYGAEFAKAMEQAPVGEWRAQSTRDGWRAMRLDAATPTKPAAFEDLRGVVLQDWTDAVMAASRTTAVRAMGKKYKVTFEADAR